MRIVYRVAAGVVIAIALIYIADAARLRLRHDPTRSIQVRVTLAVPQKNGRTEFIPGGLETRTCVNALFPHGGMEPCWYLQRHTREQVAF